MSSVKAGDSNTAAVLPGDSTEAVHPADFMAAGEVTAE